MSAERGVSMEELERGYDRVTVDTLEAGNFVLNHKTRREVTKVVDNGRRVIIRLDNGLVCIDAPKEDKIWRLKKTE